ELPVRRRNELLSGPRFGFPGALGPNRKESASMVSKATPVRILALLAVLAAPAAAQQAATPLKIGVIDPERIVAESARGKLAVERLNKERDQRLAEGNRKAQEIKELQKGEKK